MRHRVGYETIPGFARLHAQAHTAAGILESVDSRRRDVDDAALEPLIRNHHVAAAAEHKPLVAVGPGRQRRIPQLRLGGDALVPGGGAADVQRGDARELHQLKVTCTCALPSTVSLL